MIRQDQAQAAPGYGGCVPETTCSWAQAGAKPMTPLAGRSRGLWALRGLLLAAALTAYWPSFRGDYVFDDLVHIVNSDRIHSFSTAVPSLWTGRPVIYFTLAVNYRIGGLNVLGYHIVNFAVHLVAGLILFGLARRTLRLPPLDAQFGRWADLIGFAAALLWLIHPLQTQAVTYIIQRCESMMGMFYLASLYCVLRASQSERRWPWYAAGVAACWLGMGCKEVMITAPVVIAIYDRIFLCSSWAEVLRRRWGFYLALVPAVAWLLTARFVTGPETIGKEYYDSAPDPFAYLMSQPLVLLQYLRLAVLPDRLCFDYQWPVLRDWSAVALPGLTVLGLFLASLAMLWFRPRLGFLAFSSFVIMAPTSSINPIADLAVEHRMYLPLALLVVLGVVGFTAVMRRFLRLRRRRAVIYALTLLILAGSWGTRTYVRNLLYTKPSALWANALAHAPTNARAMNNLGCYFSAAGDFDRAIEQYRKTIAIDPNFTLAYVNLARNLFGKKDPDAAIAVLRGAIARTLPNPVVLHCDLAFMLEQQGDTAAAEAEYRRALAINPHYGKAYYKLGRLLSQAGRPEEAIGCFQEALKERPNHSGANFRLAWAYQRCGKFPQAIDYYRRALVITPTLEKAQKNLELCMAGRRDGEPPENESEQNGEKTAGRPVPGQREQNPGRQEARAADVRPNLAGGGQ